jgi:hypothetical protein
MQTDEQTGLISPVYINFMNTVERTQKQKYLHDETKKTVWSRFIGLHSFLSDETEKWDPYTP